MSEYYLENAFELNKEYPDTFEIPSKKEIDSLKVSELAKFKTKKSKTARPMTIGV